MLWAWEEGEAGEGREVNRGVEWADPEGILEGEKGGVSGAWKGGKGGEWCVQIMVKVYKNVQARVRRGEG